MSTSRRKVAVVEDDARMRERLASAVENEPRLELVATADSLATARDAFSRALPEVLLIDLGLPDGSGVELIRELRHASRELRILVISVFGDERTVIDAVRAGANGYLLKDGPPEQIAGAILELVDGGAPLSAPVARYLLRMVQAGAGNEAESAPDEDGAPELTAREVEILKLFAKGFSTNEIAELLSLSPHTVVAHGRSIHRKLEVNSRTAAIYEAAKHGIIRLPE